MDDKAIQIVSFMDTVEKLCYIERFATLKNKRRESDSDHIMKLSFLVMLISDFLGSNINKTRLFELALVHDLAEADAGDVSYMAQYKNNQIIEDKKNREQEVIQKYASILPTPTGNKIADLFSEYEERVTVESKIIHCLDKLEGDLQCCKDVNLLTFCHHKAFLSRLEALKDHKYSHMTNEPIIKSLENIILSKSMKITNSPAEPIKETSYDKIFK